MLQTWLVWNLSVTHPRTKTVDVLDELNVGDGFEREEPWGFQGYKKTAMKPITQATEPFEEERRQIFNEKDWSAR